jgi:hypothetical protein
MFPMGSLMMFLKFPMSSSPKVVVKKGFIKFLYSQPVPNGFPHDVPQVPNVFFPQGCCQ